MGEIVLVGSTGFVGGNLAAKGNFTRQYHSTDVHLGFGANNDLVVYAGVPAAMFLANADPEADLAIMRTARENIRNLNPKQLVLISSICVYADSRGKTEADLPAADGLPAYGANRLQLEQWVREDRPDALIVRLPALYGLGLKKNFLYDLHTITPAMLRPAKYEELAAKSELVRQGYSDAGNGFYKLNGRVDAAALRQWFAAGAFNALCFTDSRSRYQYYDLRRLWDDIQTALAAGLTTLNLTTPPVSAAEVYAAVTGKNDFVNQLAAAPFDYDLRSIYAEILGGADDYLCTKQQELDSIVEFMKGWN
ncbi:MAG: sugar nucleotide-binding protein [Faecalibacterium sp.]|nr:sugar nucleotide-binding protein [Faecalibacterium sp.]